MNCKETALNRIDPRYESLRRIMWECYDHATIGKGEIRHGDGKPFEDQISGAITRLVGIGYPLGQAVKKYNESQRLEVEAAINEIKGAVNYLQLAILNLRQVSEGVTKEEREGLKG